MTNPVRIVTIDYTNWRGERAVRRVVPQMILFANNEWHPEAQWLLEAVDADTGEARTFALKNIHSWKPWGTP
jgi:predicted DNA-binding transcriptional regulator YafY